MIEAAAVIGVDGAVLHWHLPPGRTEASLPDSRALWDVLWSRRDALAGVAHTHPGSGPPAPSQEDLTTFAACEAALGRRLAWWIATSDHLYAFTWCGPARTDYRGDPVPDAPPWLAELRSHTNPDPGGRDDPP